MQFADLIRRMRLVPAVLLIGLVSSSYVLFTNSNAQIFRWDPSKLPLKIRLWDGFEAGGPAIISTTSPKVALKQALYEWARNSTALISVDTTQVKVASQDGLNLVTVADDPINRSLVGQSLSVTLLWSQKQGTQDLVVESDVVFNPSPAKPWSTDERTDATNLFDVALHEFGHVMGLQHPISRGSRMYFQAGYFGFRPSALTMDDILGVNRVFPMLGIEQLTGSITGRVLKQGSPVFGAFVIAVDEEGTLVSNAVTLPDGSFQLRLLPPGSYTLYVEPLDGPTTPLHIAGGIFDQAAIDAEFLPRLYRDSLSPLVSVRVGETTSGIVFAVEAGRTPLDPELIGVSENPSRDGVRVTTRPFDVRADQSTQLVLAGNGVQDLSESGVEAAGPNFGVGKLLNTYTSPSGLVFKFFPLTVYGSALPGEYPVFLKSGSHLGVVTGAMQVTSSLRFGESLSHIVHLPGSAETEIFTLNPSLQVPAEIGLSPWSQAGEGGALLDLEGNGTRFQVPPGGIRFVESRGSQEFHGSVVVQSDQWVAAGALLRTNSGTTGVGAIPALRSFVTPVEILSARINTGVALTNLDRRPALVFAQLQDPNGSIRGQQVLEIPGHGQIARFVGELINGAGDNFRGSIAVTSTRPLAATSIRTEPGIFTTFPVIQNSVNTQIYFPQFVQFGSLTSELLLVNPSPTRSAEGVQIQVRNRLGNPTPVTLDGTPLRNGLLTTRIPPLGSVVLKATGSEVIGSLEVSSSTPLGGVVLFESPEFGIAGVGSSPPGKKLAVPLDRDESNGRDTGLAIRNVGLETTTIRVTVRDESGQIVVNGKEFSLPGSGQMAEFPNQSTLDLGLPAKFRGSIWLEADHEVAVTAIRQSTGVLTTLPVFPLQRHISPRVW